MNMDATLYLAVMDSAEEVFSIVTTEDFPDGNYRKLASLIDSARHRVSQRDLADYVRSEVLQRGTIPPSFVIDILTCGITGTPTYWATKVRNDGLRMRLTYVLQRGLNNLAGTQDVPSAIAQVKTEVAALELPIEEANETWTLEDIMGLSLEQRRYTIPHLLARSERLVLTGKEGGGKSVLIYQLLTAASFGIDPLTQNRCDPQRVMFVDVENSVYQQRDQLDRLVPLFRRLAPDAQPEWRSLKRRTINLLATRDRADLVRAVVQFSPDILYIGTAYRLTHDDNDVHRSVRAIQSTVDVIREELDCSVLIEHHAGHGTQNDRNGMRPEGSSFWMRWPDFGKGMVPKVLPGDTRRFMLLSSWRENRTSREWPVAFIQDSVMPWRPVMADEYAARYESLFGDYRLP